MSRPLDAAERAAAQVSDEPYEPSVGRAASLVANVPATIALARAYQAQLRGDPETQIAFAVGPWPRSARASRPCVPSPAGTWAWPSGCAAGLREAERRWRPASRNCGRPASGSWPCGSASTSARSSGPRADLDAALATYQQALEIAAPPGQPPLPAAGIALRAAWPRWPTSGTSSTPPGSTSTGASDRAGCSSTAQPLATGLATLAWIRQAGGRPGGRRGRGRRGSAMRAQLERGQRAQPGAGPAGAAAAGPGDLAAAGWTGTRASTPTTSRLSREPDYLVLARVLLAQDRPDQAIALLARLQAAHLPKAGPAACSR